MLMVEDEPALVEVVNDILGREMGCHVVSATNVDEAKQDPRRAEQVDLVITDINLPDGNGMNLLPALRKHSPTATAIVITGSPSIDGAITAIQGGAVDFVPKPFDADPARRPRPQGAGPPGRRRPRGAALRPAPRSRQAAQRVAPVDQQEGRPALQRPGHRVRRALAPARRRPHAGRLPQVRRERQGPRAAPLPRDGLAAPPDRLQQRRGVADAPRTATSSSART